MIKTSIRDNRFITKMVEKYSVLHQASAERNFFNFKFADQFVTKRTRRGCQRLVTSAELYDTKRRAVAAIATYCIAFCYEIE